MSDTVNATPLPGAATASPEASTNPNVTPLPASKPAPDPANSTPPPGLAGGRLLLQRLVQLVQAKGGSDIHLLEGERPRVRLRGDLLSIEVQDHPAVTGQDIIDIMEPALTPDQKESFQREQDIDFSLQFGNATGRVNIGYANGRRLHMVMRYLKEQIVPIDQIGLDPHMLKKMASRGSGVVVVSGETSSGKTTTIAAMLDFINHTRYGSITTIENPVEYSFVQDKCLITRREIGRDTPDFAHALRASVRKNPDVLLIGEVRDKETATIALSAAETGIQTFCTLHAIGVIPAITRLRNIMDSGSSDHTEFYQRLSHCLAGVISQQLVKSVDGNGLLPLYEILTMEYAERNYLRDGDIERLEHSLESDHSISLGHCAYKLWHQTPRRIDENTVVQVFGDQSKLMMNRLNDPVSWKPLITGI